MKHRTFLQIQATILLIATFLFLPCQRSQAPIPVVAELCIKLLTLTGIGAVAAIVYRCDQGHYLCCFEDESKDPSLRHWESSTASVATLKKTYGKRWEGPWKDPKEPKDRAWANNQRPEDPPFGPSPLGTIPAPNTNALRQILQQRADMNPSRPWVSVATNTPLDLNDNFSFAMLPAAGTNGMTPAQLDEVAACDVVFTNTVLVGNLFRFAP